MKHCYTLFFLLFFFSLNASSQQPSIERVDPPHWWTGMKSHELQLMVHGKNIALTTPRLRYDSVKIMRFATLESPNYLFINLDIQPGAQPGTFSIGFYQDEKQVAAYDYELKVREPGSAIRQGFDRSDVIYLLMPDRFANGNPANDSIPGMREQTHRSNPNGRHGGDIQGIADHLGYIRDLGATAIWVNPLLENNMPAFSYHGYAITDFYKIDPHFGTLDEYKNLIADMHNMGMKMVMDMVFNHCGLYNWWMDDLPSEDWINQWPEFTRSNFRASTVFDPYVSDYDRRHFFRGWFDTTMPDLNQHNEYLLTYLIQNSIWWIEEVGLDGIRMDTYPYPFKDAMAKWADRVTTEYPNFSMVGEVWMGNPSQVAVWEGNDAIDAGYASHLPWVFDFPMYDAFGSAFTENPGWTSGMNRIHDILTRDFLYGKQANVVIFADNHDGSRLFSKLNERPELQNMALTFLLTTRGVPQVYYGTEILMSGVESEGHGRMRKDFPGGWTGDTLNKFKASGRTAEEQHTFEHMKTLLNYRKTHPVLQTGQLRHFLPADGVYVYFRYNRDHLVMVILNNAAEARILDKARYAEIIGDFDSGKNILDGKTYSLGQLNLPPKSSMVLEIK